MKSGADMLGLAIIGGRAMARLEGCPTGQSKVYFTKTVQFTDNLL